jgi:anti-sigma B factor antagonist
MTDLNFSARDAGSGFRLLEVEGELGLADTDRLQQAIDSEAAGTAGVIVGLGKCEFIDSTALAVLVAAHNRFAEQGRRLVLYGPTAQVRRVLEVTGLRQSGLVFNDLEEALG